MKKSTINTVGSISMFLVAVVSVIVIASNFTPPPEGHVTFDSPIENDSEYTVWYGFDDGSWATIPRNPITGERGVEITEDELKTLKLAE